MASSDKTNKRTPIQRVALAVVRAEMHLYDAMASKPRYRVEPATRPFDASCDIHVTMHCAHDVRLIDPCDECERNEQDCIPYRRAASVRLKALLKTLGE